MNITLITAKLNIFNISFIIFTIILKLFYTPASTVNKIGDKSVEKKLIYYK